MLPGIDDPSTWIDLLTLVVMEIVLGIDNLVFISILVSRLPASARPRAMRLGIGLSVVMRIGLLFGIRAVMGLTAPLFTVLGNELSGRDLILLAGGLFLIGKATIEIRNKVEGLHDGSEEDTREEDIPLGRILAQIVFVDAVFSLDSIITAVGMVPPEQIWVMVCAVLTAVAVMLLFAEPVGRFVNDNPSVKILALAFLVLIGAVLVADGTGHHVPKGYIYFPLAFSVSVEALNLRFRKNARKKVPAEGPPNGA
ncbi:MAG: TerC family protein [Deltaproteobacteria bacterium]|jgi:predicted tellurium resistance membrane protein TerC